MRHPYGYGGSSPDLSFSLTPKAGIQTTLDAIDQRRLDRAAQINQLNSQLPEQPLRTVTLNPSEPAGPSPDVSAPQARRGAADHIAGFLEAGIDPLGHIDNQLERWKQGGYKLGSTELKTVGPQLHRAARFATGASRLLPLLPIGMAAVQGYDEGGVGGAALGTAGAVGGAMIGGAVLPVIGAPIGALVGTMIASKGNELAANAVDDAQFGLDTPGAALGRVLDPFFKSNTERAADDVTRQMEDPARQALIQEEERRNSLAQSRRINEAMFQAAITPIPY
jgi:hypothetical protein